MKVPLGTLLLGGAVVFVAAAPLHGQDISPQWELNFGAVIGLTPATDRFLLKMIVGRRFDF